MRRLSILVVEDEILTATLLGQVLHDMGHQVCGSVNTEAHAVAAAARWKPDLMIVDVGLVGGCGITAVDKIAQTAFIPHVFVSADLSRVRARRPQAVMIQKPFFAPDLTRAMELAMIELDTRAGA